MAHEGSTHSHHGIDYVELTVTEVAAAKQFYAAAFGWAFNDYGPDYAGIAHGGREIGGLCANATARYPDRGASGPLVVLYSQDLDATNAAVRAAGGAIVKDTFSFPGGRRFHFADPSGNELAVWSER